MTSSWHPAMRAGVALALIGLAIVAVRVLWPFLTPLALALLLTYMLVPLVSTIEQNSGWSRTAATLLVYVLLIIGIALLVGLFVPVVVEQVLALIPILQRGVDEFGQPISGVGTLNIFGQAVDPYQLYLDFADQINEQLVAFTTSFASSSVTLLFGVASTFLSTILWSLFILVISFYIVRDSHNISLYFWSLIPREQRAEVYYLIRRIARTWNAFLRGQLLLSTVIFVATTSILFLLGVPQALFLGILAGILNLIPNLGPVLSAVPAAILALLQGSTHLEMSNLFFALVVLGAYVLIQQLESNILVPRIIGGSVHLHPAVVLLGAIVGLRLIGLLGIFLAAPTLASIRVIGGYAYRKMLTPNFQPEIIVPPSITEVPDPRERPPTPIAASPGEAEQAWWRVWAARLRPRR